MDAVNQAYRDLQKFLDTLPGGFSATESGSDIRLLKCLFTPEEARVAVNLTLEPEPAKRIYNRIKKIGISVCFEELHRILESMLRKGTLRPYYKGYNEIHYGAPDPTAGGMFSVQLDHKLTREFYDHYKAYTEEVFPKRKPGPIALNPLRTIPVEKSIPHPEKFTVNTYDSVRMMIETSPGPFAVANCICRQKTKLLGNKCARTNLEETCLMIGPDQARRYVDMGIGRFITREEVFNILKQAQEDGLVIQPENSQKPEAICICCGDCCALLKPMKSLPRPAEFFLTNYYVEVDPDRCNGCEICIGKCQMDARIMADGIAVVNLDRCIGCGNCVVLCPLNANSLHKKEQEIILPKDKDHYFKNLLSFKRGQQVETCAPPPMRNNPTCS